MLGQTLCYVVAVVVNIQSVEEENLKFCGFTIGLTATHISSPFFAALQPLTSCQSTSDQSSTTPSSSHDPRFPLASRGKCERLKFEHGSASVSIS